MNLTLVISSLSVGGAERILSIMANFWADAGHAVTILSYADGSEPPFYSLRPQISHVALGIAGNTQGFREAASANLNRVRRLRKAIVESKPTCVISFMDTINVSTLIASAGTGLPVIITEHCYPPMTDMRWIWRVLRRLVYPTADSLVVQTEKTKSWFPPRVQRKTKVIPNPIYWESDVSESPFVARADRPRIISVGRMEAPKRFDLLIEAFASVVRDRDCELMLVGDGTDRPALERLTTDLALEDRVHFTGLIKNPKPLLESADIFVLASDFEGFPGTLVEAMSCGLAVISFDCPVGPRAIIRNGIDGLLVAPSDIDSLAQAMLRILDDDAERKRLGERAREVNTRFSLQTIMKMWDELILDVCGAS